MLFLPREEGQGLVEYALILVLVAMCYRHSPACSARSSATFFSNIVVTVGSSRARHSFFIF